MQSDLSSLEEQKCALVHGSVKWQGERPDKGPRGAPTTGLSCVESRWLVARCEIARIPVSPRCIAQRWFASSKRRPPRRALRLISGQRVSVSSRRVLNGDGSFLTAQGSTSSPATADSPSCSETQADSPSGTARRRLLGDLTAPGQGRRTACASARLRHVLGGGRATARAVRQARRRGAGEWLTVPGLARTSLVGWRPSSPPQHRCDGRVVGQSRRLAA